MEKENTKPVFEIVLIVAGCVVYCMGHSNNFFESLGGLFGMAFGALFFAYLPYAFLKKKIKNALLKVFSVTFLLVNLLVLISS